MRTLVLPIYRRCNQSCRFCAVVDQLDGAPIPARELRDAIDRAKADGVDAVCLTGGEPTLAPALIRALAYANGIGLHTAITTNGRLLADPEKVGRLVAVGLDAVNISLHAADRDTHASLTGGDPVAFDQTVEGLAACAQHFDTTLRMVLTRANADHVPALVALAAEHGTRFDLRIAQHVGATTPDLVPSAAEALSAWRTARGHTQALGVPFHAWGLRTTPVADGATGSGVELDPIRLEQWSEGWIDPEMRAGVAVPEGDRARIRDGLAARWHTEPAAVPWIAHALGVDGLGEVRRPVRAGVKRVRLVDALGTPDRVRRLVWPAVAEGLRAADVEVEVSSWRDHLTAGRGLSRWLGRGPPDADAQAAAGAALQARFDPGDADVVVVWGATDAGWVQQACGPTVAVWVIDGGDDAPLSLRAPDRLWSCFPGSAQALALAGVDLSRVLWGDVPLSAPHHDASGDVHVVVAGGPAVDAPLVRAAAPDGLDGGLRTWPDTRVASVPALEPSAGAPRDGAPHDAALDALCTARALWVPVKPGPGVDPIALALAAACGVPVVGTPAPRVDHAVRPGRGLVAAATAQAQAHALATATRGAGADLVAPFVAALVGARPAEDLPWPM